MSSTYSYNKSFIANNFSKYSLIYEKNANLQKKVAKYLINNFKNDLLNKESIIDFGSGTGFLLDELLKIGLDINFIKKYLNIDISPNMILFTKNKYLKYHNVENIIYDIENIDKINFNYKFDIAISSLSMQWLNDIESFLLKIKKIIKINGKYIFSIIDDNSFFQLKLAMSQTRSYMYINDFIKLDHLKEILQKNNFTYKIISKNITTYWDDIYQFCKNIKNIGASYRSNNIYNNKNIISDFKKIDQYLKKNFYCNKRKKIKINYFINYVAINY